MDKNIEITIEQRELYLYTKDTFNNELENISPACVSPLICTKRIVKRAIERYEKWYGSKDSNIFSNDDFLKVSEKIYNEIINNNL